MLARIVNTLLEGLNSRDHLPRFIVVVLDKDIIEETNVYEPDSAVIKAYNTAIFHLAKQINLWIKRKRIYISGKNPGAVFREDVEVCRILLTQLYSR